MYLQMVIKTVFTETSWTDQLVGLVDRSGGPGSELAQDWFLSTLFGSSDFKSSNLVLYVNFECCILL